MIYQLPPLDSPIDQGDVVENCPVALPSPGPAVPSLLALTHGQQRQGFDRFTGLADLPKGDGAVAALTLDGLVAGTRPVQVRDDKVAERVVVGRQIECVDGVLGRVADDAVVFVDRDLRALRGIVFRCGDEGDPRDGGAVLAFGVREAHPVLSRTTER